MILHRMYCGLQNSVIRSRVFDRFRFEAKSRNEAEDQLFLLWSLVHGHRVAYFDDVHLDYFIHDANSSASVNAPLGEKQAHVFIQLIAGYEQMGRDCH